MNEYYVVYKSIMKSFAHIFFFHRQFQIHFRHRKKKSRTEREKENIEEIQWIYWGISWVYDFNQVDVSAHFFLRFFFLWNEMWSSNFFLFGVVLIQISFEETFTFGLIQNHLLCFLSRAITLQFFFYLSIFFLSFNLKFLSENILLLRDA